MIINKSIQYPIIEKFMGYTEEQAALSIKYTDYAVYISDLWLVIGKCREIAQDNPTTMVKPWLAIALELYRVPEDITPLYEIVYGFIEYYNEIVNVTPTSEELQDNHG